jgi:hypothetical protein
MIKLNFQLIILEIIQIKIVVQQAIIQLDNSVLNVMLQSTGIQLHKNVLPVNQDLFGILNFMFVIVVQHQDKLLMQNVNVQLVKHGLDLIVHVQLEHLVLTV